MIVALTLLSIQGTSPSTTFGTDPTEPLTRFELVLDHAELRRDAMRTALATRFDYGFLDRFAVRADVPFASSDRGSLGSETGLGDVRAQFGWRAYDERTFAMFFAGGVVVDTASDDALGARSDRGFVMAAAAGALPEIRSRLTETIEHFVSYDRRDGAEGVALTKIDIQLMTEWSPRIWTRGGTELFVDWHGGEHTGMNLDFEVGRATESGFAVWIGAGVGLFGHDIDGVVDWRMALGARWLF
jgi:hypothetical protein